MRPAPSHAWPMTVGHMLNWWISWTPAPLTTMLLSENAQLRRFPLSSDMAEMIAIAALMIASVARLADGEAVDVPSNIQRHAFKNTPEEAGHHPVNMQIPWAWTVSLEVQPPFLSPVGLPVSPFFHRSYHGSRNQQFLNNDFQGWVFLCPHKISDCNTVEERHSKAPLS